MTKEEKKQAIIEMRKMGLPEKDIQAIIKTA